MNKFVISMETQPGEQLMRKELAKFTESKGVEAKRFQQGAEAALACVWHSGMDIDWIDLQLETDGNGSPCWKVYYKSRPPTDGDVQ